MIPEDCKHESDRESKTRWIIERRLEFIDFRLFWDGRVNRGDLIAHFGVSTPQASADLARYETLAPGNLLYDKSAKTYLASPSFQPAFISPSADAYLAQLRLMASGILSEIQCTVLSPPEFSVMPVLRRRLEPSVLRLVLQTIRANQSLEIHYQSLSRPAPIWRWISPHALGYDGFRWHIRAWCNERSDFRDFVIARVLDVRGTRSSNVDGKSDLGWNKFITLKIGPHPKLIGGAREAIELDYGMVDGVVEITTRACLSTYFERSLGLDLDPNIAAPERQQIVLLNRMEVDKARADMNHASEIA